MCVYGTWYVSSRMSWGWSGGAVFTSLGRGRTDLGATPTKVADADAPLSPTLPVGPLSSSGCLPTSNFPINNLRPSPPWHPVARDAQAITDPRRYSPKSLFLCILLAFFQTHISLPILPLNFMSRKYTTLSFKWQSSIFEHPDLMILSQLLATFQNIVKVY